MTLKYLWWFLRSRIRDRHVVDTKININVLSCFIIFPYNHVLSHQRTRTRVGASVDPRTKQLHRALKCLRWLLRSRIRERRVVHTKIISVLSRGCAQKDPCGAIYKCLHKQNDKKTRIDCRALILTNNISQIKCRLSAPTELTDENCVGYFASSGKKTENRVCDVRSVITIQRTEQYILTSLPQYERNPRTIGPF